MLILFTLLSDNFNPGLFNPTAQTFMIEKLMIETSGVEKFLLALGLKSPGLKVGVENSRVEMSCNHHI